MSFINEWYFFRVGAPNSPTRFLNYVDAIRGFRHLLEQIDLDKAQSMCSKMKGQLKSRFIVLNDDRVLPPPPQSGVAGVSHHRGRGRGGRGGRGTVRGSFQGKGVKRTQDLEDGELSTTPSKR